MRNDSRRDELERIKKLKSDKTFEKADILKALAMRFINEGEKEEGSRALDLASEEIINSGRRLTSQ